MKTLFVEKKAMELRYERACLLLYHEGKRISSVPLAQLERIVVAPHVALSAGVLGLVAEKGVGLLVVNHRYPDRTALLSSHPKGDVERRLTQYRKHQDEAFCLHWAIYLVRLKLNRQYRMLASLRQSRPDLRHPLTVALQTLKNLILTTTPDQVSNLATLRGKEGAGAAAYFKAYTQLFAPALEFNGRNKRPPRDPVNVCLSLVYTLLYQEAVTALQTRGLDPNLGCFHQPFYNRASLACDLMEPLRPFIEHWVYELFQRSVLRCEHFSKESDSACLLGSEGKTRFYESYRHEVVSYRRLLRRYARFAAQVVNQHGTGR
jgi:CRISPR-associated protein Cas1